MFEFVFLSSVTHDGDHTVHANRVTLYLLSEDGWRVKCGGLLKVNLSYEGQEDPTLITGTILASKEWSKDWVEEFKDTFPGVQVTLV